MLIELKRGDLMLSENNLKAVKEFLFIFGLIALFYMVFFVLGMVN